MLLSPIPSASAIIFLALIGLWSIAFYSLGFACAVPIYIKCMRAAKESGLDAALCARRGALYSVLNIGLGVYFLRRLQGKQTRTHTTGAYYILLLASWLTLALYAALISVTFFAEPTAPNSLEYILTDMTYLLFIIIGFAGTAFWIVSLGCLIKSLFAGNPINPRASNYEISNPYVLPFILSFLTYTTPLALFFVRPGFFY